MSAEILAIGPYSADIADALEYPPEMYARTKPGVPVVTTLFSMFGSSMSRDLAAHLGITDPWDFNQHKVTPGTIDLDALRTFLLTLHESDEYLRDLDVFVRLRDRGFEFYFLPNY